MTGEVDDPKLRPTPNAFQSTPGGSSDAFTIKLDPSASTILYSSYLGGNAFDAARDIKIDANGYMYVYGYTSSADFPLKDSLQTFRGGGALMDDFFITKLTPSGNSVVYSTLLGGSRNELPGRITLDEAGTVYVVGTRGSPNFPVVKAYQPLPGGGADGILAKISDNTASLPASSPSSSRPAMHRANRSSLLSSAT